MEIVKAIFAFTGHEAATNAKRKRVRGDISRSLGQCLQACQVCRGLVAMTLGVRYIRPLIRNGGNGGSMTTLYFTAGPNREQDGLFGAIDYVVALTGEGHK